ncbi:MAG: hypothetical protein ACXWP5_00575 [Bdellovibrionota bacterium]
MKHENNQTFTYHHPMNPRRIQLTLWSLVALDVIISTAGFGFPQLWFKVFHGAPYVDPQGLLRRSAGSWAAFALFQTLAALRWKREPHWLVLVAGMRLGEIFTDWAYLGFAANITWFGAASLLAVVPSNAYLGWWLLRCYQKETGRPRIG